MTEVLGRLVELGRICSELDVSIRENAYSRALRTVEEINVAQERGGNDLQEYADQFGHVDLMWAPK